MDMDVSILSDINSHIINLHFWSCYLISFHNEQSFNYSREVYWVQIKGQAQL